MAADQEMRNFTRGLFQSSPDLSVLTLAIVRRKYLAHVGRESLVREEKELLKELVKEELLRMQLDDSSSEEGSPSPKSTWDTPQAWTQKRPHSSSDLSGGPEDTARKKRRLDPGSEASSDGEDSEIDSRKPKEDAGKSRHTGAHEDEGDSGAEETPDRGGASRESDSEWTARSEGPKQPPRRRKEGAEAQDQLEKKRVREAEQRGDCGEQKGKANGGITAQPEEESGSESPVEEEECKWQKRTGKTGPRKIKQRSDSEEEGDSKKKGRMKAWGKEVGSGTEVDEMCQSRKGAGKKGRRKAGRWSDGEEEENKEKITKAQREEESGSEEEEGRSRKPGTKKAELERKKRRTKAQSEEESGSELEEEEEGRNRKPAGKTGTKKVERRSDSEAEEVGSRKKRRTKAQSEEESGTEEEEGASRKETGKKRRRKAERGSKSEEEGKVQARQRGSSETDEDSSSSSSAQDENSPNPGSRREKGKAPGSRGAGPAEEHPAVRRLKRYILACGVRRNYKKLLAGCRSVKQRVGVLRRELEAIGLQGNPSLERCRALRLRREEAAEVAALDVGNIITSDGRPRRCNIWSLYSTPPAAPPATPPARCPVDWSSLRGVISSDGESE